MSRRVSKQVSSIGTLIERQVDKQVSEREEFETVKREDRAILTPAGDVQYVVNLLTKVTVSIRLKEEIVRTVPRLA